MTTITDHTKEEQRFNKLVPLFGLTGSSGSGKSEAARILSSLGVFIIDADDLAREVVKPGSKVLDSIKSQFGSKVIDECGSLDRKQLGKIVFNDRSMLISLEKLVHPAISELFLKNLRSTIDKIISKKISKHSICYMAPLFFEKKIEHKYDLNFCCSVLIVCEDSLKIKRLMKRDEISYTEAQKRLSSQMPDNNKIKLADIVINNNGSLDDLKSSCIEAYEKIKTLYF